MNKYDLTEEEDLHLRLSVILPGKKRSLYEYLSALSLEDLKAYPRKGYHWWMGRAARTPQALALRNYVLFWRSATLAFRQQYPRAYLETLSPAELRLFLHTYIQKTPLWAYEEPVRDVIHLLLQKSQLRLATDLNTTQNTIKSVNGSRESQSLSKLQTISTSP